MTTIPAPPTRVDACPLCHRIATREPLDQVHARINCAFCGVFKISDSVYVALRSFPQKMLNALTRSVQLGNVEHRDPQLSLQSLAQLMAPYL